MAAERIVRIVAGFFILLSLSLGVEVSPLFVSKHFLWLTAFVGLNLFQSGFTNFCPLTSILAKFGIKAALQQVPIPSNNPHSCRSPWEIQVVTRAYH